MKRREFNAMLLGAVGLAAAPAAAKVRSKALVLYSAVADQLTRYEVDPLSATLTKREAVTLPSTIQYAWPHPSRPFLYVVTSDAPGGVRTIAGKVHRLRTLRIANDGSLSQQGDDQTLPQRPIHVSTDHAGRFVLVAYNTVADLSVHPVQPDGVAGAAINEPADLDKGIFPHQVRVLPGDRSVVLVTRGNDATAKHPEDPGALKFYRFDSGKLSPRASVAVGGRGGLGYGPRHLDFHPDRPWGYVALERQNELHMHRIVDGVFAPAPDFIRRTTEQDNRKVRQVAGAIHMHPRGRAVYVSNRASGTIDVDGQKVAQGGDNSIAVFAIHPKSGEPVLVQRADPQGYHVRSFTIDPDGKLLIAATMQPMQVREDGKVETVPAGLALFRIAPDGRLTFVRKYDVELADDETQVWVQALRV
jgi:6-phosphogluconolactonase (cycloisomerase 2 family)